MMGRAAARLSDRTLHRLAWAAFAACLLMVAVRIAVEAVTPHADGSTAWGGQDGIVSSASLVAMILAFPLVGVLIARRQPHNRIAWILLAVGIAWCLSFVADSYAQYGLVVDPGSLPAAGVVAAVNEATWVPGIGLMGTYLILLFPDGRLPSRRWRWVAWASGITMIVISVAIIFSPGTLQESPVPGMQNPITIESLAPLFKALLFTLVLFPVCILACALALVLRFRRSRGVERLQLKWLATAGALVAGIYALVLASTGIASLDGISGSERVWLPVVQTIGLFVFVLIPVAIGVAVLKHGLYGIDVVINKALVFGALGAFITGVYVAIVVGIGAAIGQGNHSLALSIAATAVVAIAFQPVRERVQRLANRLVYGQRATPYEVLSDFASRMGGTYESADLLPRMARTIAEGTGAAEVNVWLKVGADLTAEATWPARQGRAPDPVRLPGDELPTLAGDRVVPVRHQGELLGAIAVRKKPGEPITPTENKLLDDVAVQAGLVLRNVRLIEELRSSRERLVRSQDTERRRLERNLHDGAQQSLVSVALLLRMTQSQLGADPDRIAPALDEASDQLKTAIEELRELARGIHPAILTERGLGPAIASLADRSPVPTTVTCALIDRLPATIEGTVYFVVAEALANIVKYADASSVTVTVTVEQAGASLTATIADDGIGGADPTKGSGLRGLADRIAAVDGHLHIASPPGKGTRLTVDLPIPESPLLPFSEAAVLTGAARSGADQ